ncbi:Imm1 family immunity protein [Micromonospora haikouensis]|uniref:Imm1 family immunity protein n=1 Tax=Micromonospora haikouensis TaxID=686309 RepID=UPI0037B92316
MTLLLRDYHGHPYVLSSADEAGLRFDEQIETIMPHGGCGQTMTIGPADQPALRIDIDIDADRAAIRWLPDGAYAADLEPDTSITVYESPDAGLIDVPAALARVAAATARNVVVEYVATRRRPTHVPWKHEESDTSQTAP